MRVGLVGGCPADATAPLLFGCEWVDYRVE